MNFELNDNQVAILDGLGQLIAQLKIEAPKVPTVCAFSQALDAELQASGFLDIAREEDFTLVDAALVVERVARLPLSAEAAASALVGPLLAAGEFERPLALARGSATSPARFLPQAKTLLVDTGSSAELIKVDPARVRAVESLFAYPYGRLDGTAGLEVRPLPASILPAMRRRWRLAIAVEAAGLMSAAIETVLDHVKTRNQFGRPLGSFQAVQHRLAMAATTMEASKWLALRAAWSDEEGDCATAATYVQDAIPTLTYDLHQFCGAMGLTLEFDLHLWTYRLKALLGELGGSSAQAQAAASSVWDQAD